MTTRVLPPKDWPMLIGTELETVWPVLNPETAKVIVVEDGDAIVGCWALFPVMHCEGVWVAPTHRGRGVVARHLWRTMRALASLDGAKSLMTGCVSSQVEELIEHLDGVKLPGQQFVIPVKG